MSKPKPSHLAWTLLYTFFAVIFLGPMVAGITSAVFAGLVCRWSIDNGELKLSMVVLLFTIIIALFVAHMLFTLKIMYIVNMISIPLISYGLIIIIYIPLREKIDMKIKSIEEKI